MVIGLKAIKGISFVKLLVKKFQLTKEIFIYEIEKGEMESLIPEVLSQRHLPYSFRFYDPTIAII